MSNTLFRYIFKDLLRIFLLTSGALAGIMSFGGLLRPLTEHGLDAAQAAKMLSYFMPAMMTYSLPIAALFATTVVYGRLAADNELVACRAAGISFFSIGMPALVLGLTVALVSLLFLCFIVPVFTLKVERVIYSNLAQLISNEIERTHQIKFQDTTIFAQEAQVAEDDPSHPQEQVVSLGGVMIVSYEKQDSAVKDTTSLFVPREFYLAKQVTVFIRRDKQDNYTLEAKLESPGGAMFPRHFTSERGSQGGVAETQFGPIVIDSLIKEDTKFMDIRKLHELYLDVGKSRRVQEEVQKIVRAAQEATYLAQIGQTLSLPAGKFHFDAGREQYDLIAPAGGAKIVKGRLLITPAVLVQTDAKGKPSFTWNAMDIELSARPVSDDQINVQATLHDVTTQSAEGSTARKSFARPFTVAMPPHLKELADKDVNFYRTAPGVTNLERNVLQRALLRVQNSIQSEMHSRASFAVSCLILVIVGCALGMMFKSGNFLSAFALSVIPALVSIALICAGQHTCDNIPWKIDANFHNPLSMGLSLIWMGNVLVAAIGVALLRWLQRQ
jgi:lipopolysaccharide export LptBFGC system permease protein LptF